MAIDRALIFLGNGMPEIYGIEDPRNPVARMITRRELLSLFGNEVYAPIYPDELLWVVEVIGSVSTEGPPPTSGVTTYQYAMSIADPTSGWPNGDRVYDDPKFTYVD